MKESRQTQLLLVALLAIANLLLFGLLGALASVAHEELRVWLALSAGFMLLSLLAGAAMFRLLARSRRRERELLQARGAADAQGETRSPVSCA